MNVDRTRSAAPPARRTARKAGRPRETDSAATRARILRAAIQCLSRHGLQRTTLNDIAHEADVAQGTLTFHFGGKSELYAAAFEWSVNELYARYSQATAGVSGVRAKVEAVLRASLEIEANEPEIFNVLLRTYVEQREYGIGVIPVPLPVHSFLDTLTREAVEDGEIGADDGEMLISVVRCLMTGLSMAALAEQDIGILADGLVRLINGTLLRG